MEIKELLEMTNYCDDWEWEDYQYQLQEILDKTLIKRGFLQIHGGGWRKARGMTDIFDMSAKELLSQLGDFEWTLHIYKEGHKVFFNRSSHDEPTGALITLHPEREYNKIYKEIFNE